MRRRRASPKGLTIDSRFALIAVRGTKFFAVASERPSGVFVEEGAVDVTAAGQDGEAQFGPRAPISPSPAIRLEKCAAGASPRSPRRWRWSSSSAVSNAFWLHRQVLPGLCKEGHPFTADWACDDRRTGARRIWSSTKPASSARLTARPVSARVNRISRCMGVPDITQLNVSPTWLTNSYKRL